MVRFDPEEKEAERVLCDLCIFNRVVLFIFCDLSSNCIYLFGGGAKSREWTMEALSFVASKSAYCDFKVIIGLNLLL